MSSDYPPPAFSFKVLFGGGGGAFDTSFQEVSGIKASVETENYQELGENNYTVKLPKSLSHNNLVLKRGIADLRSPLVRWCRSIFEGNFTEAIEPKSLQVHLIDHNKLPLRSWSFTNAYPLSWEVENFSSSKNEVAIEAIELHYDYSSRLL